MRYPVCRCGKPLRLTEVNRFKWVHDKKVISHAALSPGSALRSQKS
jgi:hypothetical protein